MTEGVNETEICKIMKSHLLTKWICPACGTSVPLCPELTKATKSPHLNEARPRMSPCVCACRVYVCVLALQLVQTALNEGAYGDKGVPPPPPVPPPTPPPPLCPTKPLRPPPPPPSTHHPSLTHSFPSESYKKKKKKNAHPPHSRNCPLPRPPPPPPPRREDLQFNHCKCPARHSINPNP